MKILVFTCLALAVMASHPITQEYVDELKKVASFEVMSPEENPFTYWTEDEIRSIMGTILSDFQFLPDESQQVADDFSFTAPESYNFDESYPQCVEEVRDQARCGSCWAFGATEAFEDRYCQAKGTNIRFSPQDLVSCEKDQFACDGGYLNRAWNHMASYGVVEDKCMPYTSFEGEVEECPKNDCSETGKSQHGEDAKYQKYKVKNPKQICGIFDSTTVCQNKIKQDLVDYGSIEVGFTVYQDFMQYKSGVYKHVSGS